MSAFEIQTLPLDAISEIGDQFCVQHGDPPHGVIPDEEFDRLYDHLVSVLKSHGSFTEESDLGSADFHGNRYMDQIPVIGIVPRDELEPGVAMRAGLDAISNSHRPLCVEFDFYPDSVMVCSPAAVYTTFESCRLNPNSEQAGADQPATAPESKAE